MHPGKNEVKCCVVASEDQRGFHKNKQMHSVEVNLTVTGDPEGHCEQPPHVTKETGYQSGEWLSFCNLLASSETFLVC